jgi:hypothetical protein
MEAGNMQICQDLMQVLRNLIANEQQNMNIIKLSVMNMLQLKAIHPSFGEQYGSDILKELIES